MLQPAVKLHFEFEIADGIHSSLEPPHIFPLNDHCKQKSGIPDGNAAHPFNASFC